MSALTEALRDREMTVVICAVRSLRDIGPEARLAVPSLIALRNVQNEELVDAAVMTLGRIGPAAVPALRVLLQSKALPDRGFAALALSLIGAMRSPRSSRPCMRATSTRGGLPRVPC